MLSSSFMVLFYLTWLNNTIFTLRQADPSNDTRLDFMRNPIIQNQQEIEKNFGADWTGLILSDLLLLYWGNKNF